METKKLCPIHHFRYTGFRCPICEQERISNMTNRLSVCKQKEEEKQESNHEPNYTLDDLVAKFNAKTK